MATEAAAAAEKLAAKKAAKVEEARKRAAAAAAKQAAADKLLEETLEHVMSQAVEEQPKLRAAHGPLRPSSAAPSLWRTTFPASARPRMRCVVRNW